MILMLFLCRIDGASSGAARDCAGARRGVAGFDSAPRLPARIGRRAA